MEASSAINQPHVDEADAEAAAFFGDEAPEAAVPAQDADGEGPLADDPGPSDTRSDLEKAEDAYQYKVSHGEEVPPELEVAHTAFLAGGTVVETPAEDDTQARLRAIAEREAAEKAAEDPTGETTEVPASDATGEASGGADVTQPAAPAGQTESNSGPQEREYIVFQKLALTEKVLKYLLAQIDSGDAPEPRVAYFELHRATTRNDKQATAEAYNANKSTLGEKCDLAAVSSRSLRERHVEIKPVTETALSIT